MSEEKNSNSSSRRLFMKTGLFGLGFSLIGSVGATVEFLFPKVLYEPSRLLKLKKLEDYPDQDVIFDEENRLFLIRRNDGFSALTAVCTHLGCTINQNDSAGGFSCPCHGSVFDTEGNVVSGPAPKSLNWYHVDLSRDGRIQVYTDRKVSPDFALKTNV